MKVLYISHLTSLSGSTIALLNIINQMINKKVQVGVVLPERKGWLYDQISSLRVDVFDIGEYYPWLLEKPKKDGLFDYIRKNVEYCKYIIHIHKQFHLLIKKYKPDLVHCNNATIDYALYSCKKLGIPHIWHVREYQDLDFKFNTFPSLDFLRWKMHLKTNHCIAITEGIYKHFRLDKKDYVIYDGVINTDRKTQQIENKPLYPYFLFVGAIIHSKGLHVILEHFGNFHENHPEVHLIVTSTLDEQTEYSLYCRKLAIDGGFENYIHYLGRRSDVYELMQNAIAQIVPSYFEGFGFITAEAMYNNCLVIGRNSAGTKEQFDNGVKWIGSEIGLRFTDEKELPLLMEKAINQDFSEIKNRAYMCVVNNYTTKINSEHLYNCYQNILSNRNK